MADMSWQLYNVFKIVTPFWFTKDKKRGSKANYIPNLSVPENQCRDAQTPNEQKDRKSKKRTLTFLA